ALMAAHVGSARAWRDLGLLSLAATLVTWNVFTSTSGAIRPARAERRWSLAHTRLAFAYGTFGFGYIIPATFIPVLAKELLRNPIAFGWAWPVFGAAAALSTLVMKLVAERGSARTLWASAQLVMAFGVAAPLALPGMAGIALAALCVGGTFMVVTMSGMLEARRIAPAGAASLMAAMTAAFAAGQIAGPVLVSLVLASGGGFSAALLIACGALAAGACALWERAP
ncbi:MAG: YbfB/YjiJ family MFS transporter, partial [Burkholderiales bacterium]